MPFVIIIFVLVVIVLGVRIIPQSRAKVVERLGSYHETLQTGVHYVIPFIDLLFEVIMKHFKQEFIM